LIPSLPLIFHASADDASWAITATLLTASIAPIAGRLGDMFGKRWMLVVSMVFLFVGSVVSALCTGLVVVLGRALQGLAMGAIALGGSASFATSFPPNASAPASPG